MLKQWKTEIVKLSDVDQQEKNCRSIDLSAFQGLKESIRRFGLVELIVWNRTTGHIVSGHQRLAVLLQDGVSEAPMIVVEMTPDEEVSAGLTMNNPNIEGEFDEPIMELIGQVEKAAPDLYKAVRIDELKASLEKSIPRSPDGDSEPEWDTECPCCGNKWKVDAKDVTIVMGKAGQQ